MATIREILSWKLFRRRRELGEATGFEPSFPIATEREIYNLGLLAPMHWQEIPRVAVVKKESAGWYNIMLRGCDKPTHYASMTHTEAPVAIRHLESRLRFDEFAWSCVIGFKEFQQWPPDMVQEMVRTKLVHCGFDLSLPVQKRRDKVLARFHYLQMFPHKASIHDTWEFVSPPRES